MPTKASWNESFYDGQCKVVKGRIEKYKPTWASELVGSRGFSFEPDAEPSVAETADEQTNGQAEATVQRPKRSKGAKNENN
jgi:hypothetical protein